MTMLEGTDDAWLADEIRSDEELAALATEARLPYLQEVLVWF